MAQRFEMKSAVLLDTLKNTVFKGASNEQLAALVVVANEHGLNPFTREIYAFPDKSGGIQAVVGIDGWLRIINSNPKFDGVEVAYEGEGDAMACTATIYHRDRNHPVVVTEYLSECKRNTEPWKSHPRRMLRHKAIIQAARIAFGFGALKDEDDVIKVHPASVTVERSADDLSQAIGAAPAKTKVEAEPEMPLGDEKRPAFDVLKEQTAKEVGEPAVLKFIEAECGAAFGSLDEIPEREREKIASYVLDNWSNLTA